jgi:hypothetical protein
MAELKPRRPARAFSFYFNFVLVCPQKRISLQRTTKRTLHCEDNIRVIGPLRRGAGAAALS